MKIDVLGFLDNGVKDKNKIASNLRMGITTINNQISELLEEKKISKDLSVLPIGKKELKEKKVSNVIILAAGWGSRMSPATDNTPKPLIKLNGTPMIETTIETLMKAGMKDITIVTGKLASKFDYLIEKYGIKIIVNNEWAERNNIGSLEKAKEHLGNTLILEGDSPLYEPNIVLKYINDPLCFGAYNEGPTPEWSYKLRGNDIQKLEKGGCDTYIWKGGWYTNQESSDLYRSWFKDHYDNPMYRDADAAFVMIDILKQKNKHARLYRIQDADMVEIDTFKELCAIDPSYKELKHE